MFGIVDDIRQGNEMKVRLWLDNTENDPNLSDDHRFSLLHWAAKSGNLSIVEMLLMVRYNERSLVFENRLTCINS